MTNEEVLADLLASLSGQVTVLAHACGILLATHPAREKLLPVIEGLETHGNANANDSIGQKAFVRGVAEAIATIQASTKAARAGELLRDLEIDEGH